MLFYAVIKHYVPCMLCISSCFCIIPSIYVAWKSGLCRPVAIYLITLAIVDLLTGFCLTFLSLDHFLLRFMASDSAQHTYSLIEDLVGEMIDVLLLISNWLTVAVAVERYLAICYPLSVRCLSQRVRKRIVVGIILTAAFLQFPPLATYIPTLRSFWIALAPFNLWFTRVLVLLILPCAILIFVTVRLIQAIRSSFILKRGTYNAASFEFSSTDDCTSVCRCSISKSTRLTVAFTLNGPLASEQNRQASKEERVITINLICLISVFFLCQVPFILLSVAFKLCQPSAEVMSPRTLNFTKEAVFKEDLFLSDVNITVVLNGSAVADIVANSVAISDASMHVLAYIRAFSAIFLMLKGDLYFLFYCWLCDNFFQAFKSFLRRR